MNNDFGLYLVMTDPRAGYTACAEAAVRAGVRFVQLRMKDADAVCLLRTAREVRAVTRGSGTLFIVNDDAELAAAVEADGVHVGQTDAPLEQVRLRFPQLRSFGLSTHSLEQMQAACRLKPDYIGVGPFFRTPTKPDYPAIGLETGASIIRAATVPAVAIGGIDAEQLPRLIGAGVRNYAVVRAVCQSPAPYDAIRRLQEIAGAERLLQRVP